MKRSPPDVFLSVVIPVYGGRESLPELFRRLHQTLAEITDKFEVIAVDDRCPQHSWSVLQELVVEYPNVVAVRLSRNYGQHSAITAGLDLSRGQWTVVMDCDLQDQPEEIHRLLAKAREGFDVVIARRMDRKDHWLKRQGSWCFHKSFNLLSGCKTDHTTGCFRLMHRKVVDAICQMREAHRLFTGFVEWVGFSTEYINVEHAERQEGRSGYTLGKLLRLATDGIFAFSNRPLHVSIIMGLTISGLAGTYGVYLLLCYFFVGEFGVPGWLSTVTLTAFIGGLILLNQGVIGIYLGHVYNEVKQRPLYVIDEIKAHLPMESESTEFVSPEVEREIAS